MSSFPEFDNVEFKSFCALEVEEFRNAFSKETGDIIGRKSFDSVGAKLLLVEVLPLPLDVIVSNDKFEISESDLDMKRSALFFVVAVDG